MVEWVIRLGIFIAGGSIGAVLMAIVGVGARGEMMNQPGRGRLSTPWRRRCAKCGYCPGPDGGLAPSHEVEYLPGRDLLRVRCLRCRCAWTCVPEDSSRGEGAGDPGVYVGSDGDSILSGTNPTKGL